MQNNMLQAHTYHYSGHDQAGVSVFGEIEAANIMIAKAILRKQGIIINRISKKSKVFHFFSMQWISSKDISYFMRQLATTLQAGIPLIKSFDIVIHSTSNQQMKMLLIKVKEDIAKGQTFAKALKKHPNHFKPLFCNLIYAGEQAGALDKFIEDIANYQERLESLKAKIKKSLWYPMAIISLAILVILLLMTFVVPQFKILFKGFGADLPWLTLVVINCSEWLQHYWYLIVFMCLIIGFGFVYAQRQSSQFRRQFDRMLLCIPLLGSLISCSLIARFAHTLAITLAAGIPLIDALQITAKTLGNSVYSTATIGLSVEVAKGTALHIAVRNTGLFPELVIQMLAIGEASGSLESMLVKIADIFSQRVDNSVDGLSNLIEPIIIAMLGILVGGLVIAMYLPIFKLGSVI